MIVVATRHLASFYQFWHSVHNSSQTPPKKREFKAGTDTFQDFYPFRNNLFSYSIALNTAILRSLINIEAYGETTKIYVSFYNEGSHPGS